MIDPVKILQRAWHILWNYRALWVFGLILAIAASSSGNGGNNNNVQWRENNPTYPMPSFSSPQEFFDYARQNMNRLFEQGIPNLDISGEALKAFVWTMVGFLAFMFLISIVVTIAYYVSVTSVIRMVDEYENTGTKMTVREGFQVGWSHSAWRVFLINLLVHLPLLLLATTLLAVGGIIAWRAINGEMIFNSGSIVTMVGLTFLAIFFVIIVTFALLLLRPFFWRVCVLEDAGVGEALRRGFAMVRENWKSAGVMWLVMIGLGLAWLIVSIIVIILTIPVVVLTAIVAAAVVALPGLLLVGLFSLFLGGPLPWIAAAIFILPPFFLIAFSPWLLLGSWQQVYTSTVWTLTYREIKALPATLVPSTDMEPVGD
jgi:hypothetical protein